MTLTTVKQAIFSNSSLNPVILKSAAKKANALINEVIASRSYGKRFDVNTTFSIVVYSEDSIYLVVNGEETRVTLPNIVIGEEFVLGNTHNTKLMYALEANGYYLDEHCREARKTRLFCAEEHIVAKAILNLDLEVH